MTENIHKSKIKKCSKCKSKRISFIEVWTGHTITWHLNDGVFDINDGALEPGDPSSLHVRCLDCKYTYKIRKANQISDIIKD
jgi:hypothetical protein